MVSESTGCSDPELLERLYQHYVSPAAWTLAPDAAAALADISATGKASSIMQCCMQQYFRTCMPLVLTVGSVLMWQA